ncbi:hypothetical protein LTR56_016236 [Elasticomyces elasticus]|nr:hypothetical protein LTR56_016236 [Elasticomyces elasticus]KAK3636078.1 hypothetical protein LTR22_018925 [Elasticomyces elasticus]KAK4912309.1 hypothetical protein LTR49_019217 [Elasticomyces elasticus]KAK5751382.1 hypothetical protein LTS12_018540 [Elasticomyces elasticus]
MRWTTSFITYKIPLDLEITHTTTPPHHSMHLFGTDTPRGIMAKAPGHGRSKNQSAPTNFTPLYSPTITQISLPKRVTRQDDGHGIDDRYTGQLVVVKTFKTASPNPLPSGILAEFADITTTWPAEIEAGLLLSQTQSVGEAALVPVIDYFTLRHNTSDSWSWAMVTPYTTGGTLVTLASASRQNNRSPEELNLTFRPAFERLLTDLSMLHAAGYCHDDVKPGNIFVQSPTRWLVGDLGNLQQKSHPWHDTHYWTRRLQWADCELNDARRAVKTYMSFLRAASADVDEFDREFLAAAGWSRIYWEFMARPMSAVGLLSSSLMMLGEQNSTTEAVPSILGRRYGPRWIVVRELTCTMTWGRCLEWDATYEHGMR